ncbi:MAG: hypothetical protein WCI51_10515 [Lentisphaerota bacterium]
MFNMKKPPILIIINMLLLSAGYFFCVYPYFERIIDEMRCGTSVRPYLIPLLFFTFGIICIYIAVLKRQAKSILFWGTLLFLIGIFTCSDLFSNKLTAVITVCLFLITGILFVIWSIILLDALNQSEDICSKCAKKYKYWLYSAICFGAGGMFFGGLGYSFWSRLLKRYEAISLNMYKIMGILLLLSVLQFVIYYILCKIREHKEKRVNSTEKN